MAKPIFVWQNRVLVAIKTDNIIALATEKNYTKIFLANKKYYMVRTTLSGLLKKLPPGMFNKIHRSFAVATNHIEEVYRDHLIVADEGIPIAKQFYPKLIEQLDIIE